MPENLLILLVGLFSLNEDIIIITIYCKCMNIISNLLELILMKTKLFAHTHWQQTTDVEFSLAEILKLKVTALFTTGFHTLYVFVLVLMIKIVILETYL